MALRARLRGIAPSFVNGGVPFLAHKCPKAQTLRFLSATVTLSRKYRGRGYAPHARTARTHAPVTPNCRGRANPNPARADKGSGGENMKVSYRVAMAQELLRLLAEAQDSKNADCRRLQALVAKQVAELLA